MKKLNKKSASPPPPLLKKTCPCTILPAPFSIFRSPLSPPAYYFVQNLCWVDAFIGQIFWVRCSLQHTRESATFPEVLFHELHRLVLTVSNCFCNPCPCQFFVTLIMITQQETEWNFNQFAGISVYNQVLIKDFATSTDIV